MTQKSTNAPPITHRVPGGWLTCLPSSRPPLSRRIWSKNLSLIISRCRLCAPPGRTPGAPRMNDGSAHQRREGGRGAGINKSGYERGAARHAERRTGLGWPQTQATSSGPRPQQCQRNFPTPVHKVAAHSAESERPGVTQTPSDLGVEGLRAPCPAERPSRVRWVCSSSRSLSELHQSTRRGSMSTAYPPNQPISW